MMQAILSRDVTVKFNGGGSKRMRYDVKAKAGTWLNLIKDASGTEGDLWAIPPHLCKVEYPSLFRHDSTYYYIWAPKDAVKIVEATQ